MAEINDEDLDELRKLSPEERIRKLKEFEQKKKKEIEDAERLVTESQAELKDIEEDKKEYEKRAKESIDKIIKDSQQSQDLENQVATSEPSPEERQVLETTTQQAYQIDRQTPIEQIEQRLDYLTGVVDTMGHIPGNMYQEVQYLNQAFQEKQSDVTNNTYNPTEDFEKNVDSTKKMIDNLLGMYK